MTVCIAAFNGIPAIAAGATVAVVICAITIVEAQPDNVTAIAGFRYNVRTIE
jgi:hypothetical protein